VRQGPADFAKVWCIDFEFYQPPGERPDPHCLVAREINGGQEIRLWQDDLRKLSAAPYSVNHDSLIVAYYAVAELSCHLALGWPVPINVLDLYVEFRNLTNGKQLPCGAGLLGALTFFGFDATGALYKDAMQKLAQRGGPYTEDEKTALISYCAEDVLSLSKLLRRMYGSQ
jgi:DNA polymerase I